MIKKRVSYLQEQFKGLINLHPDVDKIGKYTGSSRRDPLLFVTPKHLVYYGPINNFELDSGDTTSQIYWPSNKDNKIEHYWRPFDINAQKDTGNYIEVNFSKGDVYGWARFTTKRFISPNRSIVVQTTGFIKGDLLTEIETKIHSYEDTHKSISSPDSDEPKPHQKELPSLTHLEDWNDIRIMDSIDTWNEYCEKMVDEYRKRVPLDHVYNSRPNSTSTISDKTDSEAPSPETLPQSTTSLKRSFDDSGFNTNRSSTSNSKTQKMPSQFSLNSPVNDENRSNTYPMSE